MVGESSKIFYLDEKHNIVPEEEAVKCVIQVFDESGNIIQEVWGKVEPAQNKRKNRISIKQWFQRMLGK